METTPGSVAKNYVRVLKNKKQKKRMKKKLFSVNLVKYVELKMENNNSGWLQRSVMKEGGWKQWGKKKK